MSRVSFGMHSAPSLAQHMAGTCVSDASWFRRHVQGLPVSTAPERRGFGVHLSG